MNIPNNIYFLLNMGRTKAPNNTRVGIPNKSLSLIDWLSSKVGSGLTTTTEGVIDLGGVLTKSTTLNYNGLKFIAGTPISYGGADVIGFEGINSLLGVDYRVCIGLLNTDPNNTTSKIPLMSFQTNTEEYSMSITGDGGVALSCEEISSGDNQAVFIKQGEIILNRSDYSGNTTFELKITSDNKLEIIGLEEYADDTAAGVGGLITNQIYVNSTTKALTIKQ